MVGGAAVGERVAPRPLREERRGHDDALDLDLRIGDQLLHTARGDQRAGLGLEDSGLALIELDLAIFILEPADVAMLVADAVRLQPGEDRKSTRLNSSH